MKNFRKGFTLIELLVVVLIIGILSAVALPQYTKAVEKTRFMEAYSIGRVIYDAQERYRMANGGYAESLDDLDVTIGELKNYTVSMECDNVADYIGDDPNCVIYFVRKNGSDDTISSFDIYFYDSYLGGKCYGKLCKNILPCQIEDIGTSIKCDRLYY